MYRVLLAGLKHEVNSFSSGVADLDTFRRNVLFEGADVLGSGRGSGQEIDGVVAVARAEGVELIPVIDAYAGAAPPVADAAYEYIRDRVLAAARAEAGRLDGVMLCLHGAMATESLEDPEGDMAAAVRAIVGSRMPIAVSYDMHCHFTATKASAPDIIVGFHTHPHVDFYDTGVRAMRLLVKAMRGEAKPVVAYRKLPMMASAERHNTSLPPASEVMGRCLEMEQEAGVLAATYFPSQPWMDLSELGWATVVVADGDRALAQAKADELAQMCWQRREQYLVHKTPVRAAIEKALGGAGQPWVFTDSSDSVSGGGHGDGNFLLRELLATGYADTALLTLTDPEAATACFAAGVGGQVTMPLGGKLNPQFFQPVMVSGRVKTLTDGKFTRDLPPSPKNAGPTAVLQVGTIHIVVTSYPVQTIDTSAYHMAGLEPRQYKIVQVKSPGGFRAVYGPFAAGIFELDAPGPCDSELPRLPFKRIRRPLWPFDPDLPAPW
ncbi:MAG: M81 family metallopeptidase [Chloroflexi bacterium]|nr:M81 family metallopeptidase [Chloroflexota bacterium]